MHRDRGYRAQQREPRWLTMDDDGDVLLDQCAACGCTACLLEEQFADGGRGPSHRSPGPTAALPARRAGRYPFPSS